MSSTRWSAGALLLMAVAGSAPAGAQVSGPVQIGPSWGRADPARRSAVLDTVLVNHGDVADRLIRADCPAGGQVALRNGTLHDDVAVPNAAGAKGAHAPQNGLDLPPGLHGGVHPVTATFDLTGAVGPLADGTQVPCTVTLAHGGQRIVVFTIGEAPQPTAEP